MARKGPGGTRCARTDAGCPGSYRVPTARTWRPLTTATYRAQLGPHGGGEDSSCAALHPLLGRSLPPTTHPSRNTSEAEPLGGASQEGCGGRIGAGLLVFPPTTSALRGLECVLSGCLRCTEEARRDQPGRRRCVASGGS